MVVPIFSNSAASTLGIVIARAPGATRVVLVLVTSMGDCCLLTAQAEFSAVRPAQLVLGEVLVNNFEARVADVRANGSDVSKLSNFDSLLDLSTLLSLGVDLTSQETGTVTT